MGRGSGKREWEEGVGILKESGMEKRAKWRRGLMQEGGEEDK